MVCNGQTIEDNMAWGIDADQEKEGTQLPDLRHRFIRGSADELNRVGIEFGGKDEIQLTHAHLWASLRNHEWWTYNENNEEFRVDDWNRGHDDGGDGEKPLKSHDDFGTRDLYTIEHTETIETIPQYAELRYIIKVR